MDWIDPSMDRIGLDWIWMTVTPYLNYSLAETWTEVWGGDEVGA